MVSGKTTLVDGLVERLSASRLRSPPDELRHLRAAFDSKPSVARRAYYNLGNYLLARHINQLTMHRTVVIDRYSINAQSPLIPLAVSFL